jgi:aspartyl protease family protein
MQMRLLPLLLVLSVLPLHAMAETQVSVVGLFSGKAVLVINGGKPRTLSAGQTSPEGVRLLAADSSKAVLEVEGKRKELGMGQGVTIAGAVSSEQVATLYATQAGHFVGEAFINEKPVKFLLDTGATSVVINAGEARRLGLDYQSGQVGAAQTAAGVVKAYRVSLNTVRIGGITMHQVEGAVLEGDSPPLVLLGMSALNRMEMKRDGIAMTLTKKY